MKKGVYKNTLTKIGIKGDSTKDTYDKLARLYSKIIKSEDRDHRYIENFLLLLNPGDKILDVGAGTGKVSNEMIISHQLSVTAIDISKGMMKLAKARYPFLKYKLMDLRRLNFPSKSFDALFANYSLIHTLESEVPLALEGFAKVLKPHGYLYLSLQAPRRSHDHDGYYPVVYNKNQKLFINLFRAEEITAYLKKAGFKILKMDMRKPHVKTEFPFNKLFVVAQKKN